jgi:hypothetical protein
MGVQMRASELMRESQLLPGDEKMLLEAVPLLWALSSEYSCAGEKVQGCSRKKCCMLFHWLGP